MIDGFLTTYYNKLLKLFDKPQERNLRDQHADCRKKLHFALRDSGKHCIIADAKCTISDGIQGRKAVFPEIKKQKGGVSMSFEAIKGISDAEALAKAKIAEAEAKAKQMLDDAETAGKAALEAASSRAETELKELRKKADGQTAEKTAALDGEMVAEAKKLRDAATQKLEKAAAIVLERIVGG